MTNIKRRKLQQRDRVGTYYYKALSGTGTKLRNVTYRPDYLLGSK